MNIIPNGKLAFFNLEGTLMARSCSPEFLAAEQKGFLEECCFVLTQDPVSYETITGLPCMQWFVKKLWRQGYGLYAVYETPVCLYDERRREQLGLFYKDTPMTYLRADTSWQKMELMQAVAYAENCPLSDVLFVDDSQVLISKARSLGMDARHLSDIVVLYETERERMETDLKTDPFQEVYTACLSELSGLEVT